MLKIQTDTYLKKYTEAYMFNQCVDEQCLYTNYNPKFQPMISNEFATKTQANNNSFALVNKSYAVINSTLHESYFYMNDLKDTNDFLYDYAEGYRNGIILVINNGHKTEDIQLLAAVLQTRLKYLIVRKSDNYTDKTLFKNKPCQIETENLDIAVSTAYNLATNGQAILFQGVNNNFDLFAHLPSNIL